MAALVRVGVVVAHRESFGGKIRVTTRLPIVERSGDDADCCGASAFIQAVSWWAEVKWCFVWGV